MIRLNLQVTQHSTISVGQLWARTLPEVIEALLARGYAVTATNLPTPKQRHLSVESYRLKPGPAMLTAETDHEADCIQLTLTGRAFGKRVHGHDTDPVIWMDLVVLGVKLHEAHCVESSVTDPDLLEH